MQNVRQPFSNGAVKNTNSTYYQGELPKYLTL